MVKRSLMGLAALLLLQQHPATALGPDEDLVAARALFEANLDAIRHRDRQAYLACYLHAPGLVRTGPEGFSLGFEAHAAAAEEGWPDAFEALDLQLTPVRPGVVYGTYRYRVRHGANEQSGLSERLFVRTEEGWKIALTTAFPAPPGTPAPPWALRGATLVDGTGAPPVPDAVVLLRNGRVACAGSREECPVPAGVDTLDVREHWITPGLVDAHVHFSQTGWADGRPDALDVRTRYPYEEVQAKLRSNPERFLRSYLCSGVTAVFDVGGYPWTWDLAARLRGNTLAPHLAAAGPLLSTLDFWLNLPGERQFIYLEDEKAARRGVAYLASHGTAAVKVWFIPVEERGFGEMVATVRAAAAEADRRDLPLIVHATGLDEAKVAVRAGARLLVHSVWDRPVDDELIALLRQQGTIYCPTLTVAAGYQRLYEAAAADRPAPIDDPNGCVDLWTRAKLAETAELDPGEVDLEARRRRLDGLRQTMTENLRRLAAEGIPIAMGTDAGNPLTLHGPSVYAEMEAMQAAGLSPFEVLEASTLGGARALGREDELGSVEAGKVADLLVVAADPTADIANLRRLRYVVRGGVVRSVEELRPPQ